MRGAWYIVDVYCILCFLRAIINAIEDRGNPTFLAITVIALIFVFFLAWRTYTGSRLASRVLSLYIIANVLANVCPDIAGARTMSVYRVYMYALFVYLFFGAIKLWRIKELPTRFTDPPAEPPAHA